MRLLDGRRPRSSPCGFVGYRATEEATLSTSARLRGDFGVLGAIRIDHGVPFVSPNALLGLSRRAIWRLRPGIKIQGSASTEALKNLAETHI